MLLPFALGVWVLINMGVTVSFASLALIIVQQRKIWVCIPAFFLGLVLAVGIKLTLTSTVMEFTSAEEINKSISLGFLIYESEDGQEVQLKRVTDTKLIINSSNSDLVITPVYYGEMPDESFDYFPIPSHSTVYYSGDIDYYPDQEPPGEVKLRNYQKSDVKKWLTYDE